MLALCWPCADPVLPRHRTGADFVQAQGQDRRQHRNGIKTTRHGQSHILNLDLGRAPYVLYNVKYIGLVSLALCWHVILKKCTSRPPFLCRNGAKSGFEMCLGPSTLGAGAKPRLESGMRNVRHICVLQAATRTSCTRTRVRPHPPSDIPFFIPTYVRLYGVVSLHVCVPPYMSRKILKMSLILTQLGGKWGAGTYWQGRNLGATPLHLAS